MSANDLKTFDVTLRTKHTTLSRADAAEYLRDKVDMEALSHDATIEAEEESSRPHIGPDHPARRAIDGAMRALSIAVSLQQKADSVLAAQGMAAAIEEQLREVPERVSDLWLLLIRTERAMEEVREREVRLSLELNGAHDSYLALYAEYEADKKQWAQIEAWNTRLVSQIRIVRAARPLSLVAP